MEIATLYIDGFCSPLVLVFIMQELSKPEGRKTRQEREIFD